MNDIQKDFLARCDDSIKDHVLLTEENRNTFGKICTFIEEVYGYPGVVYHNGSSIEMGDFIDAIIRFYDLFYGV